MNIYFKSSLLLLSATIAQAGDMGDTPKPYKTTPFIEAEANASWIAYKKALVNGVFSSQINNIWGGRFAAGLTRTYRDNFSLSGELGYGYYGRVRTTFSNNVNNNYFAVDGIDILAGLLYTLKSLDLYFKAGAMVQNRRVKGALDLSQEFPGDVISGVHNYNSNFAQVLPALKTGGLYNFNANFALTVSYMHVFGSTPSILETKYATRTPSISIVSASNIHDQNPSLDSILFGIQYNFT